MQIFYPSQHHQHAPGFELFNGQPTPHAEVPDRVDTILTALEKTNHSLTAITGDENTDQLTSILDHIHDHTYLEWLQNTVVTEPLYPSVFNPADEAQLHGHQSIQWGNFVTDTFTPLLSSTRQAALASAQSALVASQQLSSTNRVTASIGRPPGHHAGKSRVGGYCYLNNAAVAAENLASKGRVAILDVDYHHGNGTQDIFYHRSDVVTCSIHADPIRKFPYFAGSAQELGIDQGYGFNKNYPLPANITNQQYQPILESAISWLESTKPDYLVIALGLDTHESDPIADFKLTTEYYQHMAATISRLQVPTVVILEGGYNTGAIGDNVVSFLRGMHEER